HFISITSAFFIEKYMNKELGYPSKYLFKKLIDTSESICSPSCDERSADKKTKIKNRIIKSRGGAGFHRGDDAAGLDAG
ncbi:hypothetical protein O5287_29465, partial [Escherichia coli]|nr:hypothetical protein [Escherichia coli]